MTVWRLWCHGCPMEDYVLDVTAEQALEWVRFHSGHSLGGFATPEHSDGEA